MTQDTIVPIRPQAGQSHTQGFGTQTTMVQAETSSTAVAAQAKALVEAQFIMALHRPRDIDVARQKILETCKRPGFAERALYSKPQGQSKIEGPSIRLAEECIRGLGNIDTKVVPLYEDDDKLMLAVTVIDLENNTSYGSTVTVRKVVERQSLREGQISLGKRTNSYGKIVHLVHATEDDLLNKINAHVSKAVRTNGLRHVPADILEEAIAQVKETLRKQDAADPAAAKKKLMDAFGEVGVNVGALKQYLGHALDTVSPAELEDLRKVYATIKDGQATWQEYVETRAAERAPVKQDDQQPAAGLRRGLAQKLADKAGATRQQQPPAEEIAVEQPTSEDDVAAEDAEEQDDPPPPPAKTERAKTQPAAAQQTQRRMRSY